MEIFSKIAALFWTLTEITFIFYLNWGNSLIKGKEKGEKIFTIILIALSVESALLLFWARLALGINSEKHPRADLWHD